MTKLGLMQSWFNVRKIYKCNLLYYHIKEENVYHSDRSR